ncbi:MAG TPA: hypothetical protein VIY47_02050, partial [Ignavibacteriaceae bacterium]
LSEFSKEAKGYETSKKMGEIAEILGKEVQDIVIKSGKSESLDDLKAPVVNMSKLGLSGLETARNLNNTVSTLKTGSDASLPILTWRAEMVGSFKTAYTDPSNTLSR